MWNTLVRTCFRHVEHFADGPFLAVQGEADPAQRVEARALPLELLQSRRGLTVLVHRFQHLPVVAQRNIRITSGGS